MEFLVKMTWDSEAQVWVATSRDVPGLALEGPSLDALMERVRFAIPELTRLNKTECATDASVVFCFTANAIMAQAGIDFRF